MTKWKCEVCKAVLVMYVPVLDAPRCYRNSSHSRAVKMKEVTKDAKST